MGMYESPIKIIESTIDSISKDIAKKIDDAIFAEIQSSFGVDLDRGELLRALQYDRDQYNKGYADGKRDAMDELVRCKGCKYYTEDEFRCDHPELNWEVECYDHWIDCNPDDFCSKGERRTDNE